MTRTLVNYLSDLLLLEAVLPVAAILCAAAAITALILAVAHWPLATMNALLILVVVLLSQILRALHRITGARR